MVKILTIGQLPKEVGGNYTTGVARVVHELSKQSVDGVQQFLYATNIADEKAKKLCNYPMQYIGYRKLYWKILSNIFFHPIRTIKQWSHYKKVCHVNPLRMEFHRVNMEEAIKAIKPDIIHNHSSFVSSCFFAAKSYGIPIIRTYHGLVCKGDGDPRYLKVADEAIGTIFFAKHYTALTTENASEVERLGIDRSIITIIPNGIDSTKYYFSIEERLHMRKELGVKDNEFVFMTVGRLIDRKGQLSFLKILQSSGIDYHYWLFGDGPDYEEIKSFVTANRLDKRVILFGQVNGEVLYKYYSAADFYSHASTTEGQSLAEIEAFSSGLRIVVNSMIAGTVIGNAHNDHDNYYIMDFANTDMDSFIPWLTRKVPERKSRPYYDWSIIASLYGELYYKIMRQNGGK